MQTPSLSAALWILSLVSDASLQVPAAHLSFAMSLAVSTESSKQRSALLQTLIAAAKQKGADWSPSANILERMMAGAKQMKDPQLTGMAAELLMQISSGVVPAPTKIRPLRFDRTCTTVGVEIANGGCAVSTYTSGPTCAGGNRVYEDGVHMFGFEITRDQLSSQSVCFGE